MSGSKRKGVSKAQWLEAGLEHLATGSVHKLSIEELAIKLGIAKSGFYWHFKNREALLEELLRHWIHEFTEIIVANEDLLVMEPRDRLKKTAEMIFDSDLPRCELAIRQWAKENKQVASAVRKANKMRMHYLLAAFGELGFDGADAEIRAKTYLTYMTWDKHTFDYLSRKKRRAMIEPMIEILTS